MNTTILTGFQICISVPLRPLTSYSYVKNFYFSISLIFIHLFYKHENFLIQKLTSIIEFNLKDTIPLGDDTVQQEGNVSTRNHNGESLL